MSGTIPLSLTQQFDEFGEPLSGGKLYIYQAGTVATPQNPYQDAGLTILMPNPITLDAAGRIPQFFLADGYIKVQLDSREGIPQLVQDGILVIGPSSGGGSGGTPVAQSSLIQTGMLALFYGIGALDGFVRANAMTIGSATSGASEKADATCNQLFQFLWNVDSALPVLPSRGANSAADWAANKRITLPDWRGYGIGALDGMGNSLAARLTPSWFGAANCDLLGAVGGDEKRLLTAAQCALVSHAHGVFLYDPGHSHLISSATGGINVFRGDGGGGSFTFAAGPAGAVIVTATNANGVGGGGMTIGPAAGVSGAIGNVTAAQTQANAAASHAAVGPMKLCTVYLKL